MTLHKKTPARLFGRLSEKLKSRRGASVVIALIFLTVCLTLAAILLNATDISLRLLPDTDTERKDYLTLSSAAELIKSELLELSFEITQTTDITHANPKCPVNTSGDDASLGVEDEIGEVRKIISGGEVLDSDDITGIAAVFEDLCDRVLNDGIGSPLSVKLSDESGIFETVSADFSLDDSNRLTVRIGFDAAEAKPIVMTFGVLNQTVEYSESYASHEILHGHNAQTCEVTLTRRTMTLNWESCVITKGED